MPSPIQTTSPRATTSSSLSLLSELYAPSALPGASSHPLVGPVLPPSLESNPDSSSFSHPTNSSQGHHYSSASGTLRGSPPSASSSASSSSVTSPLMFHVIGILMVASVAVLGLSILSWFLIGCYTGTGSSGTRRSYLRDRNRDRDADDGDDQDTVSLHLDELQGHRERLRARYEELETDAWNSSVPSHISIPSGNSNRNGNANANANANANCNGNGNRESRTNPTKGNAAASERPRRFAQSQRRRRRRRNFFCTTTTMSYFRHHETREEGDESTALTTLSRDSSLASLRSTARGVDLAMVSPSPSPSPSSSDSAPVDPSGLRLSDAVTATGSDTESFPHATIQFRIPINGSFDGCDDARNVDVDVDVDLLRDFLSHTEDYVSYPRSKLTILLRARAPSTPKEEEELSRLRSMVEDAAAFSPLPLPSSLPSPPAGGRTTTTTTAATTTATTTTAAGEEPLQVCVVTACGEHDELLRCAPTGGLLVTFGSVGELPVGHSDFLRDLIA